MLSWSRTGEEIVTTTQTGGKRKRDKRRSKVKQEAVNSSDVGSSHYAQYCCFAAEGTDSKCNRVVYNVPPPHGVIHDADTSPDQKSALPQQLCVQSL